MTDTTDCILNVTAGSNRCGEECAALEALFAKHRRNARVIQAHGGDEMIGRAKDAVKRNCPLVLAAGGDGTINAVASALVDTNTALGVLPLGTLNHFAKDLKVPLELEDAVTNAFEGELARVDVGEVNGRIFLNNSSLGLYPGLVQVRESLQRQGHGKWPAFARALLFALWRYAPLSVRLTLADNSSAATTTPFVFVGNNEYELSAPHAGERPTLQAGKLWVYQAPHAGRAKLTWLAVQALLGGQHATDLAVVEAEEFWIRTRHRHLKVANDGELIRMISPLHYRSKPGALRVIVPKAAAETGP